jgi:hypothetical protein
MRGHFLRVLKGMRELAQKMDDGAWFRKFSYCVK